MRSAFISALSDIAAQDDRVWLLCGDLGFSVLEDFAQRYPARYVNVGVAEQNMTGVAAGLALSGKIVFTYSIANFPVMRCLEQLRNDVAYHNLNVKVVSVGGGLAYGSAGYTHHGIEDLAVMSALPNFAVVAPADPVETRLLTWEIARHAGPCYLRLGKSGERVLHKSDEPMTLGRAIVVRYGRHGTLVSTGGVLGLCIDAAAELGTLGREVTVISMPTLRPLDKDAILHSAGETGLLITVEEHGPGGLASAVAETLAASEVPARLGIIRLEGSPSVRAGSQAQLMASHGITVENIVRTFLSREAARR